METIVPGLVAEISHIVYPSDTAEHLGSGAASVLATPTLILWLEQTAVAALAPFVPEGSSLVHLVSFEIVAFTNSAEPRSNRFSSVVPAVGGCRRSLP